ncbi:MAG: Phosphatidate cytidylyltransferase, partial [uncultured Corynebacteriales bacterium]
GRRRRCGAGETAPRRGAQPARGDRRRPRPGRARHRDAVHVPVRVRPAAAAGHRRRGGGAGARGRQGRGAPATAAAAGRHGRDGAAGLVPRVRGADGGVPAHRPGLLRLAAGRRPGRLPAGHLHRRLRRAVRALPGRLRGAAGLAGRRREAGRRVHRDRGVQRRRRVRGRGHAGPAPDGAHGEPGQELGGLRGVDHRLLDRRDGVPDPVLRCRVVAGRAVRPGRRGDRDARRPRRVDDQAGPGDQGHGHPAAGPRRADGPAGLAAAGGRRVLGAADRVRARRL